ncbi:MAG: MFS transporter [Rhodobacteraceae bacterium]|jgi:MFS family permease|uniref:MFS transporter n=1 Tax=Albidovulum sp. TaxID=1872424 RepID=UPI002659D457|nr:MFS transporter [uncultured Defluviimonas sp.]MCC0071453.1 MFS transporter [Paracoccaceae bacterium]
MTRTTDAPSRYRWIIVAIAAAMLAVAMGQLVNGLSAFFTPLEDEFGWGRGAIAFINTAGLMGIALGGIVMGFAADRLDIRRVVLFGATVTALGMIVASAARELWQLYAVFFVTGAFGGGALFAPLFALVGVWFRTGAGLAIGIVAAGQAIGQGGIPLANAILIEALGWRGTLLALGLVALATLVPLALLVRIPPSVQGAPAEAAAEVEPPIPVRWLVVLMSAAVLCCCSLMSVPLMHLVPLIQGCGIPAPEAGSVVFVMMLAAIAGRVAFGRLADMIGAVQAYLAASAWQTALVFVFTRIDDLSLFYIFAPVYGFGYAGVMTGVLTTIRSLTPAVRRASASGVILAFAWAGHGLGGYLGGVFFDMTGTYDLTFAVAVAAGVANLTVVALVFILVLRRERRDEGLVSATPGVG